MKGTLLRHFTIKSDPAEGDGRPTEGRCPVTGKTQWPSREEVPPVYRGNALSAYFCGYCQSWHGTTRTKAEISKVRRRLGRKPLWRD